MATLCLLCCAVDAANSNASLTDRGKEEVTRGGTATFTQLQLNGFINESYPLVVRPPRLLCMPSCSGGPSPGLCTLLVHSV